MPAVLRKRFEKRTLFTASTITSTSSSEFQDRVEYALQQVEADDVVLFGLSQNQERSHLGQLVQSIQALQCRSLTGCLTGELQLRYELERQLNLIPADSFPDQPDAHSFAIARWSGADADQVVPFRSTIPGRKSIALGRNVPIPVAEDTPTEAGAEVFRATAAKGEWTSVWEKNSTDPEVHHLPSDLAGLKCVP